jgi:ribosomal protein S18 acetylase RimI-like enzyme
MNNVVVHNMADYDRDVRYEVASVFVDGYYKDLSFFSKNREKLCNAFKETFCPDVFYIAELDGGIAGILACSNNKQRAMHIDKTSMRQGLGFFMGSLACQLLKKEFNTPLDYPDDIAYIECVATSEEARGKGVCTALINHVMYNLSYSEYVLDVADTNVNAIRLYRKLGFKEFMRKPEKNAKIKGFNERIYMKWCK